MHNANDWNVCITVGGSVTGMLCIRRVKTKHHHDQYHEPQESQFFTISMFHRHRKQFHFGVAELVRAAPLGGLGACSPGKFYIVSRAILQELDDML